MTRRDAETTADAAPADVVAGWLESLHDSAELGHQPWLKRAADLIRRLPRSTIDGPAHILCLLCRGTFTDAEIEGQSACPRCGNRGVPADTRKQATATLTHHEWRILCIWAENWAERVAAKADADGYDSPRAVRSITNEIRRQAPDISPLSLRDELQQVADRIGGEVDYHDGTTLETFRPATKQ